MTSRERYLATFRYEPVDRLFMGAQWFFDETLERWREEGMPDVHHIEYFGFDTNEAVPLDPSPIPPLESKVVEHGDGWHIVEDEFGARAKHWTNREIGMPQWLSYPVRDRESWERYQARLDPDAPGRYPMNWEDLKRRYRGRDFPLGIHTGSFYGWLRNWVGMEHLALLYYDDPGLVHEMTEFVADFTLRLIDRALSEIPDVDYALVWEDMAMKTGPLISPQLFRDFMTAPLMRVTKVLKEYGIDLIEVDCDGRVDELLPLWLEADVSLVYPLEVASGCDAVRYRERHGKDLLLLGNIDKRLLRDGCTKKQIEDEVMRVVPQMVASGGYSPMVDHAVPPDVPFENFEYYWGLVTEMCAPG